MKVELDLDDGIISDIDEWRDDLPYKPSRHDFIFLAICHYLWDLNEQGTDADYDTCAVQVQNGYGYYDESGKYVSYGYDHE